MRRGARVILLTIPAPSQNNKHKTRANNKHRRRPKTGLGHLQPRQKLGRRRARQGGRRRADALGHRRRDGLFQGRRDGAARRRGCAPACPTCLPACCPCCCLSTCAPPAAAGCCAHPHRRRCRRPPPLANHATKQAPTSAPRPLAASTTAFRWTSGRASCWRRASLRRSPTSRCVVFVMSGDCDDDCDCVVVMVIACCLRVFGLSVFFADDTRTARNTHNALNKTPPATTTTTTTEHRPRSRAAASSSRRAPSSSSRAPASPSSGSPSTARS